MINVIFAESHKDDYHFDECHYAFCLSAKCQGIIGSMVLLMIQLL